MAMPVAVNAAQRLGEQIKSRRRQRQQRRLLRPLEDLLHLPPRRAVDARVGHALLPCQQMPVLVRQGREGPSLQCIALHVPDAPLDLPLVPWRVRLGRQNGDTVMLRERPDLGTQLRIEPVRPRHRCAKIVDYQRGRHPAEVSEGVLQTAKKVVGRLPLHHLGIPLAAMAQNNAEDPGRFAFTVRTDDGRAPAKVHLRLGARLAFHPAKRSWYGSRQLLHQPAHAVIAAGIAVIAGDVLVDALGCQSSFELLNNDLTPG